MPVDAAQNSGQREGKDPPGAGGRRGRHRAPFTPGLPAHGGQRWRREPSFCTRARVKPGSEDHTCSAALRPSPLPTAGLVRMYSSANPTSQPLRPHSPPPSVGRGRGGCDSRRDPAMPCSLQSPQEVKPLCDTIISVTGSPLTPTDAGCASLSSPWDSSYYHWLLLCHDLLFLIHVSVSSYY